MWENLITFTFIFIQVIEVANGDALVVKTDKGQYQKIFFSSLRPPKKDEPADQVSIFTCLKQVCNFTNSILDYIYCLMHNIDLIISI